MVIYQMRHSTLKSAAVFGLLWLWPASAPALELEEAVRQALANNPRLEAQQHRARAADHRVDAARSGYLPQMDLSVGARHTNNPAQAFMAKINQADATLEDFGPSVVNDPDPITDVATVLSVRQPLYRGGATQAQVAQAESGRVGASQALNRARLEVALGATRAFLEVQVAEARVRVTREALEAAREHRRMAENRYQAGTALRSDLLQARTRVSELEERLLSRENAKALAESQLNQILGRPLDTPISSEGSLEGDLPASPGDLAALTDRALSERPEVKRGQSSVEGAQARIEEANAALLPHINLQARVEDHRDGDSDQSWLVGAEMRWRLFGGGRWSRKEAATAQRFAAQAHLTDLQRQIRLEVKRARLDLDTARRRLETVRHAVASAEESLRTTADRYEQGATTIAELLDAELAWHQARLRKVSALFDLHVSSARLQKAVGRVPVIEEAPGEVQPRAREAGPESG